MCRGGLTRVSLSRGLIDSRGRLSGLSTAPGL
nr:MAG TPA: hypothetical protein [Caudoviricetes sp.]